MFCFFNIVFEITCCCSLAFFLSSKDGGVPNISLLLVLEDDLPHAEVEHGADVDDEQQGTDHRQGQHWEGGDIV